MRKLPLRLPDRSETGWPAVYISVGLFFHPNCPVQLLLDLVPHQHSRTEQGAVGLFSVLETWTILHYFRKKNPNQTPKTKTTSASCIYCDFFFLTCKPDKQYGSMEKTDTEIIYTHLNFFSTLKKKIKHSQKTSHINLRHYSATIISKTTLTFSLLVA